MSYAGLSSNQWISRTNLLNGVTTGNLFLKATFSNSSEWVRKDELDSWIFIDTSNSSYAAKSSNQWITKTDITPKTCIDFTIGPVYVGSTTMYFSISITNGPLPTAGALTLDFTLDNGGVGQYVFNFSGGENGTIDGTTFDTTSLTYPMTTAGTGTVTDTTFTNITYSTGDTTNCYTSGGDICINCEITPEP